MPIPPSSLRWLALVTCWLLALVICQPPATVNSPRPLGTPLSASPLDSPRAPVGTLPDLALFQRVGLTPLPADDAAPARIIDGR
jgi:hypothetical protein